MRLPCIYPLALIYGLDLSGSFYICPIFIHLLQTDINSQPHHPPLGLWYFKALFSKLEWRTQGQAREPAPALSCFTTAGYFFYLRLSNRSEVLMFTINIHMIGQNVRKLEIMLQECTHCEKSRWGRENVYQCCFMQCAESSICHHLLSSVATFPVAKQAYKLPLDAWWNFGFTALSGWRPPYCTMHKVTRTNVCTRSTRVRL